jgi:hypothetical protein
MPREGDDDPTILVRPGRRQVWPLGWVAAGLAVALLAGFMGFTLWTRTTLPPPLDLPSQTEAQIDAERPERLNVSRFAENPAVVVLDFASLTTQARMLNRVAAFVEKAGAPHDHVLDDAALAGVIRASGAAPETYYYGHDYRAPDLVRFFRLADRDQVRLTAEESWLRELLGRLGWLAGEASGALITLPRVGAEGLIDPAMRHVILHHELSHGEYFTNPDYAAYSALFWNQVLSAGERDGFRRFLGADGYDPGIEDLMINEMQAYLVHTRDPRFFAAANVGMSPARLSMLRAQFAAGMPRGWLQRVTPGQ